MFNFLLGFAAGAAAAAPDDAAATPPSNVFIYDGHVFIASGAVLIAASGGVVDHRPWEDGLFGEVHS